LQPERGGTATQALSERVYNSLKQRILTCDLEPCQRLAEVELAAEFQVSRTPLREALNRLAQEGLVVQTPYCGYSVSPLDITEIRNTGELRLILEGEATALAALRATSEDCKTLEGLARLEYTPKDRATYGSYLEANSRFHEALVRITRNPALEEAVLATLDKLQRPLYRGLDVGLDPDKATREHLLIVEAVRQGNAAAARRVQIEQITQANERIVRALRVSRDVTSRSPE
jgi:DNA-binding GntR family transcriptional regulator